jgi:Mrp family chromosome partitioning ATPase
MERIARAIELARHAGAEAARPGAPGTTRTRTVAASPEALRAHHVSGGHERSALAHAFKLLRTRILQRMRETGWNTLGVTSPQAGEGKTTIAVNLAVHTAVEVDWTVLLVDANLQAPGVAAALGLGPLPGLCEYLTQDAPLEELLVRPEFTRCVVLPGGASPENASEVLGSTRMQSLADELKHRYPNRLVLFDMPPVLGSAAGLAMLRFLEAVLLVAEEGRTSGEDVARAGQLVGAARLVGTVLAKSRGYD